jgi:uncharacterized protein YqeY
MSLKERIDDDIKKAMLSKNKGELEALRGIKSMILLAETEKGSTGELTSDAEARLLMKAAKQRRESADIFLAQSRQDLADRELFQLEIINRYLPQQLSEADLRKELERIIGEIGASGPQDMGKVMGAATKQLAGRAEGKVISAMVKELLSS